MTILIAPDSYKGSLTALQVAEIIKVAFCDEIPNVQVEIVPMADGGEGTLDAILYVNEGTVIETEVTGPMGERVKSMYGIMGSTRTVIVETASIAGLTMVPPEKRNPMLTTSYGMGEAILEAIQKGARDFLIGLGGSATNDGGLGMLTALGGKFLDADGKAAKPITASLSEIKNVDLSNLCPELRECNFKIASDVENPLCGKNGASYVFGPQKGATQEQIGDLDKGLKNFAGLIEDALQQNLQNVPGAGAAGGLGFAFMAIGGKIHSGSGVIAEATGLEKKLKRSDWVITGEGRSDQQTVFGKAPYYVAGLAKKYSVKTILISGSLEKGYESLLDHFVSCHAIVNRPMSLEEAIGNAEINLSACARNIARLIAHSTI